MSVQDVGLVDLAGHGGPAALLMQSDQHMLVIRSSGQDDLVLEILPRSARGNTHWPKDAPVCQALLQKIDRNRNVLLSRFPIRKWEIRRYEHEMVV
jgi:hypothetical protein